jgi:hypothetical protein
MYKKDIASVRPQKCTILPYFSQSYLPYFHHTALLDIQAVLKEKKEQ